MKMKNFTKHNWIKAVAVIVLMVFLFADITRAAGGDFRGMSLRRAAGFQHKAGSSPAAVGMGQDDIPPKNIFTSSMGRAFQNWTVVPILMFFIFGCITLNNRHINKYIIPSDLPSQFLQKAIINPFLYVPSENGNYRIEENTQGQRVAEELDSDGEPTGKYISFNKEGNPVEDTTGWLPNRRTGDDVDPFSYGISDDRLLPQNTKTWERLNVVKTFNYLPNGKVEITFSKMRKDVVLNKWIEVYSSLGDYQAGDSFVEIRYLDKDDKVINKAEVSFAQNQEASIVWSKKAGDIFKMSDGRKLKIFEITNKTKLWIEKPDLRWAVKDIIEAMHYELTDRLKNNVDIRIVTYPTLLKMWKKGGGVPAFYSSLLKAVVIAPDRLSNMGVKNCFNHETTHNEDHRNNFKVLNQIENVIEQAGGFPAALRDDEYLSGGTNPIQYGFLHRRGVKEIHELTPYPVTISIRSPRAWRIAGRETNVYRKAYKEIMDILHNNDYITDAQYKAALFHFNNIEKMDKSATKGFQNGRGGSGGSGFGLPEQLASRVSDAETKNMLYGLIKELSGKYLPGLHFTRDDVRIFIDKDNSEAEIIILKSKGPRARGAKELESMVMIEISSLPDVFDKKLDIGKVVISGGGVACHGKAPKTIEAWLSLLHFETNLLTVRVNFGKGIDNQLRFTLTFNKKEKSLKIGTNSAADISISDVSFYEFKSLVTGQELYQQPITALSSLLKSKDKIETKNFFAKYEDVDDYIKHGLASDMHNLIYVKKLTLDGQRLHALRHLVFKNTLKEKLDEKFRQPHRKSLVKDSPIFSIDVDQFIDLSLIAFGPDSYFAYLQWISKNNYPSDYKFTSYLQYKLFNFSDHIGSSMKFMNYAVEDLLRAHYSDEYIDLAKNNISGALYPDASESFRDKWQKFLKDVEAEKDEERKKSLFVEPDKGGKIYYWQIEEALKPLMITDKFFPIIKKTGRAADVSIEGDILSAEIHLRIQRPDEEKEKVLLETEVKMIGISPELKAKLLLLPDGFRSDHSDYNKTKDFINFILDAQKNGLAKKLAIKHNFSEDNAIEIKIDKKGLSLKGSLNRQKIV